MKTIAAFGISEGTLIQGFLTQGLKPESSSPHSHADDDEACIANISPRERLKRLIGGVIPFVIAIAILAWQISTDVDRLWRLTLFILFVSAASGYFQWRDKTWVGLASRGSRQLTDEIEKIEDEDELAQVRRQARKVSIKALWAAVVLTVIALALPQ